MKMYFQDNGQDYYYIHRHLSHFPKDDAIDSFDAQKRQNYLAMKQRYKERYLANMKGTSTEALQKLNLAMSSDEVFTNIDETLLNTLNEKVSETIQQYNLDKMMTSAYESLDDFLKTSDLKALDGLFEQINEAALLLRSNITELTAAIGKKNWVGGGRDLNKVTQELNKQIANFEGKKVRIGGAQMKKVLQSVRNLTSGLSAQTLSKAQLQSYLRHIFSTNIGEYVVSKGIKKGLNLVDVTVKDTLSGTATIKESGALKEALMEFGQKKSTTFKTDNSFKNIDVTFEDGNSFKINLGLSTKWYKGSATGANDKVTITNEQNFIHRVNQLIGQKQGRYYAYNALALVNQDGTAYSALKAAIVARTADYLVSGFGEQGDFSQFLVINGNFYSIWQIIMAIESFNAGQGSSDINPGVTDPITISASGLSAIAKKTDDAKDETPPNLHRAYARAKEQNQAIERLRLTGHFYPQRLKNALKKA